MNKGRTKRRPAPRASLCVEPGSRTAGQIQRIHGCAGKLGILPNRDYLYLQIFRITGVEKMRNLSQFQADEVIRDLERQIVNQERRRPQGNVVRIQSREQREMLTWIRSELRRIGIRDPEAYVDSVADRIFKKPHSRLTAKQTQSLIEALKSIINRKA